MFALLLSLILPTIPSVEAVNAVNESIIEDMDDLCAAVREQEGCTKTQNGDGCHITCPNGSVTCSMAYGTCWYALDGHGSGTIPTGSTYPAVCSLPI